MSRTTVSEAAGVETAAAIESADAAGTGAAPTKAKRSRSAAKKGAKAAPKARKTRANAASKSAGSTRAGSRTASTKATPKEGGRKAAKSARATRKADAKGGEARKHPGPAPRPLKAGEPPTPMAKPIGSPKAAANAGPAVEAALATFDGSRALLAKFLGIQSQNLGRILRSHRAGWAEKIPDQFVARLSAVSGIAPAEINPFVFRPEWKVPKMSKKEALAYATGEKPLPWTADAE